MHSRNSPMIKEMGNLKVENCFLFGRQTEDLSLRGSFSDSSQRLFRRGKGGHSKSFFGKKKKKNPDSWNIKRLLLILENQTS